MSKTALALVSTLVLATVPSQATASYDDTTAQMFVGAQHWWESGIYADGGFKNHYDGYFCLCECHSSPEGIFCAGGGVQPDGQTKVADFLGVFAQGADGSWDGDLSAFNTPKPFSDHFTQLTPGGEAFYTGVSQSLNEKSFVWRGKMSGVDCQYSDKCDGMCGEKANYQTWKNTCPSSSSQSHQEEQEEEAVPTLFQFFEQLAL
eukprot:GFYU01004215.1.p1 GENE.GFYU01004215.1~~GFYU01004215.1.p1  ORF type:complete len:204 (+),score=65.17 GFYU01004215.1:177-788(+)